MIRHSNSGAHKRYTGDPTGQPAQHERGGRKIRLQQARHGIPTYFRGAPWVLSAWMFILLLEIVTVEKVRQLGVLPLPGLHKEHRWITKRMLTNFHFRILSPQFSMVFRLFWKSVIMTMKTSQIIIPIYYRVDVIPKVLSIWQLNEFRFSIDFLSCLYPIRIGGKRWCTCQCCRTCNPFSWLSTPVATASRGSDDRSDTFYTACHFGKCPSPRDPRVCSNIRRGRPTLPPERSGLTTRYTDLRKIRKFSTTP